MGVQGPGMCTIKLIPVIMKNKRELLRYIYITGQAKCLPPTHNERMTRMDKNSKINQILAHLAGAASAAADGVSGAVHSAGTAVAEKYDAIKLNVELNRLQAEQKVLFEDIGRTMFLIQAGAFNRDTKGEVVDAQQMVDRFLLLADQKQQEIDLISERLHELNGEKVCPVCGKVCKPEDTFCSACGAQLPVEEAPEEAKAPVEAEEPVEEGASEEKPKAEKKK